MSVSEKPSRGEIVIYQGPDGGVEMEVRLEKETIWLNLNQLSALFDRDKSVISRHLNKVFKDGELERESVVAKYATTAADGKTYQVEYFNFDAIISVGYRVNSKRGTQFRIWATGVLRDHILQGYTVNEFRLQDLNRAVKLVADTAQRPDLSGDEAKALLDGNKRIAAALFLWFLERNEALTAAEGKPRVSNAALVAVTLLIAESQPSEKDILVRIVTHLLCDEESP